MSIGRTRRSSQNDCDVGMVPRSLRRRTAVIFMVRTILADSLRMHVSAWRRRRAKAGPRAAGAARSPLHAALITPPANTRPFHPVAGRTMFLRTCDRLEDAHVSPRPRHPVEQVPDPDPQIPANGSPLAART